MDPLDALAAPAKHTRIAAKASVVTFTNEHESSRERRCRSDSEQVGMTSFILRKHGREAVGGLRTGRSVPELALVRTYFADAFGVKRIACVSVISI